ncbi:F-box only protein 21-like [Chelonus insularis]|uniref:F-box only protein 21-like n=1 Tax=Chelonus insularis TaxID=460826 RepID=UPI00158A0B90|nr:F-box only protein 21-like [Chelonus insularis]
MATDFSITCLFSETIEYILQNDCLEFSDVLNFSLTCKYFYKAVMTNNALWKRKFFQRWPHLSEIYENNEKDGLRIHSWIDTIRSRIQCRKKLISTLSLMSQKNYRKQELAYADMEEFSLLVRPEVHPFAYHFVVDELTTLVNNSSTDVNLTHQYYARKVLRYLKQKHLAKIWSYFTYLPLEKRILEKGAILISQWSQPDQRVSESQITATLDEIAETTKQVIKARYPNHPLLFASRQDLDEWRTTNIPDNKWDKEGTRQVMNVLCEVLFENLKFHGNSETYYSSENSLIDKVLENRRGTPVTLAIVFESVARRLGVRCEPACFPAHFLLHFKEKYCYPETEEVESFYIDVLNGGKFLTKKSCPRMTGASKCPIAKFNVDQAATAVKVLHHIANNLVIAARRITQLNGRTARFRSALELALLIDPNDIHKMYDLAQFYMQHQMSMNDILDILTQCPLTTDQVEAVFQIFENYEKVNEMIAPIKLRCPTVKYAIGMIMKHRIHGYFCVITGWDPQCNATSDWMFEMNVLDEQADKPFYNVLVEDGSCRYAAQENLIISPIHLCINHDEIGKYFYKYCGNYYLPNEEKEREYPEDANIRNQLLTQNSDT